MLACASRAACAASASTPRPGRAASTASRIWRQLTRPPVGVGSEPVVALGELCDRVVAAHRDRLAQVAGRHTRHGVRHLAHGRDEARAIAEPPTITPMTTTASVKSRRRIPSSGCDSAGRRGPTRQSHERQDGRERAAIAVTRAWNDSVKVRRCRPAGSTSSIGRRQASLAIRACQSAAERRCRGRSGSRGDVSVRLLSARGWPGLRALDRSAASRGRPRCSARPEQLATATS